MINTNFLICYINSWLNQFLFSKCGIQYDELYFFWICLLRRSLLNKLEYIKSISQQTFVTNNSSLWKIENKTFANVLRCIVLESFFLSELEALKCDSACTRMCTAHKRFRWYFSTFSKNLTFNIETATKAVTIHFLLIKWIWVMISGVKKIIAYYQLLTIVCYVQQRLFVKRKRKG